MTTAFLVFCLIVTHVICIVIGARIQSGVLARLLADIFISLSKRGIPKNVILEAVDEAKIAQRHR